MFQSMGCLLVLYQGQHLGHTSLNLAKQVIWEYYLASDSVQQKTPLDIATPTAT